MKQLFLILCAVLLLCNGCKYFKKSSSETVDTLLADTMNAEEPIDSAAYFEAISSTNEAQQQVLAPSDVIRGRYYMIVGCFTVQTNAEKYVEKLKGMGYSAQIIQGRDNFQMVAAKTYDNYRASIGEIDKFRTDVTPNAWVYLKR
jgi:hypothetical protein